MFQVRKLRLLALTLMLGLLSYVAVAAVRAQTVTNCTIPAGATGCQCTGAACTAGQNFQCTPGFLTPCTQDSDCWGNTPNGSYFSAVVNNPQTCVTTGSLQGKGCNNGPQATCTQRVTCYCNMNILGNTCSTRNSAINPGGTYQPCQLV